MNREQRLEELRGDAKLPYAERIKKLLGIVQPEPVEPDWDKLKEADRRGEVAKRLMADTDVQQMFDAIEGVYMNAWRASDPRDITTRERSHIAVCVVGDLRSYLKAAVENGDAARKVMEKFADR